GTESLYGVVGSPGAPDLVTARGPALLVRRVRGRPRGVTVTLALGRPSTVRVHVGIVNAGTRLRIGSADGRVFRRSGQVRELDPALLAAGERAVADVEEVTDGGTVPAREHDPASARAGPLHQPLDLLRTRDLDEGRPIPL